MPKKRIASSNEEETCGQRLARLRQEAGYTQREIATELGISQRMVAYYEGQTDYPPTHLFPALTEVLGVSADEILGLKVIKHQSKASNQRLWRRLKEIEDLPQRDRKQLLAVVDAFLDRNRLSKRSAS